MYLYDNYYSRDWLKKVKNIKMNTKLNTIIEECSQIDSIKEYSMFKKFIMDNVKNKPIADYLMKSEFGSEGLRYGHRNAFFEYAGVDSKEQRFLFPYFEHGADLRERSVVMPNNKEIHSFVLQSPYKNIMIHRERPLAPVYNVGPYILYAKKYYDDDTFAEMKEKYGKTLLLFPAHKYEKAEVSYDEAKFVKDVMDKFKDDYDTILISVYWYDVDDSIYERFEAEGAKLVSAGFREDPNFIVRLRAIMEFSNLVASNMTGSYIGYSKALRIPFYMFEERAKFYDIAHIGSEEQEKEYACTLNRIYAAFSEIHPTEAQLKEQEKIYKYFWGGSDCFKTKEEARVMISLSSKLLAKCGGTIKGYENIVQDVIKGNNRANLNSDEMELLLNSIYIENEG